MPSVPAATDSVRASLTAALQELQDEHAELVSRAARIEESATQLRNMLEGLSGISVRSEPRSGGPKLQVSEERLERVRAYLSDHQRARQSDISKAIGENSGTVSVALRVLAREGFVVKGNLEKGSTVWHLATASEV